MSTLLKGVPRIDMHNISGRGYHGWLRDDGISVLIAIRGWR